MTDEVLYIMTTVVLHYTIMIEYCLLFRNHTII